VSIVGACEAISVAAAAADEEEEETSLENLHQYTRIVNTSVGVVSFCLAFA